MEAYKCDRCGRHFDHIGKVRVSEVVAKDYQLCPSCEQDLLSCLHNENIEELYTVYADNEPLYSCSKETMDKILKGGH